MDFELICFILEKYKIKKKKNSSFKKADRILLWENGAPDEENTVYVMPGKQVIKPAASVIPGEQGKKPETDEAYGEKIKYRRSLLIYPHTVKTSGSEYICLEKVQDEAQILNALLMAKAHLDHLFSELSGCDSEQEVIDAASRILGSPFFYFDPSYRILAITSDAEFPDDAEWCHMKEKGFLSLDSVKRMQESGDLDMLADKIEPCPYNADYYPFQSIVCNIWNEDVFLSRLNMLCVCKDPDQLMIEECRIICDRLRKIAVLSGKQRYYNGPVNNMVIDLLSGLQLSEELIADRLSHMPDIKGSLIQVGCIEINVHNDPQILSYYASLADRMFEEDPVLALKFEGNVVLIMHAEDEDSFSALYAKLNEMLSSQGLKCALSNRFRRFNMVRCYYLQALNILSVTKKDTGITHFREVYFEHVISFLAADQALSMISYDILRLEELQGGYLFSLTDTLRAYLECGCNLNRTAKKLFIHKNTALYRLNHIRDILGSDLENEDQRMQLMFSFRILDRYG